MDVRRVGPVAVVGAGVIGLAVADRLLDAGFAVVVVADVWTPDTTSDGAGALWERRTDAHAARARATLRHYMALIDGGDGADAGVGWVDGDFWSHEEQQYTGFGGDVPFLRAASPAAVAAVRARTGEPLRSGLESRSVVVDSPTYMRWLLARVTSRGGELVHARVGDLRELSAHFRVVVNASGLGARELAPDATVRAFRGQVVRAYAPHVTRFSLVPSSSDVEGGGATCTYVLPRPTSGVVTCGGTFQRDDERVGTDAGDGAALWRRCCALEPLLADPRTVRIDEWAGLRPGRDGDVRVDLEALEAPGGGALHVVHAYGHGGCGHSLHWGTAVDAVVLASTAARTVLAGAPPGGVLPSLPRLVGPAPVIRTSVHVLLPQLARAAAAAAAGDVDAIAAATASRPGVPASVVLQGRVP